MSLVEKVEKAIGIQMSDLADRICQDYKAEVTRNIKHKENSSGEAANSIQVEQKDDVSYRIGAENLHLFFFEEGNGTGGIPKGGRKPIRPMPMTYGTHGSPQRFRMHASNYEGKHCNKTVADKYR